MARLDVELTNRGLTTSRSHAQQLIADGKVCVDGVVVEKAATPVPEGAQLAVDRGEDYVSRAAGKLADALDAFADTELGAVVVAGRRALDAGASTGGFTQVLLRRGAAHVVAVDVGSGQLDPRVRTDPRVTVLENTNVRTLDPALVAPAPSLLVADLSFISLRLVLAPLAAVLVAECDAVVLIKPQFEVGRERLGSGGVVTREADRTGAVVGVLDAASEVGFRAMALVRSSVTGMHGNTEFVAWLRRDGRGVPAGAELAHRRLASSAGSGQVVTADWGRDERH